MPTNPAEQSDRPTNSTSPGPAPTFSILASDLRVLARKEYLLGLLLLARVALHNTYRNTFLGMTWSLLQPAIQVLVYSIVFTTIMRFSLKDFTLYLISGLLPWTFITGSLLASADSLISRGNVLKACLISKALFPIADALVQFYMFCLAFVAMYGFIVLFVAPFEWRVLLLPIALVPILIFTFSASIAIAYLAPYARDLGHLLAVGFASLFWFTPIIYPIEMLPEPLLTVVQHNPLYLLIRPVQIIVYGVNFPLLEAVAYSMIIAAAAVIVAYAVYRKLRQRVIFYI